MQAALPYIGCCVETCKVPFFESFASGLHATEAKAMKQLGCVSECMAELHQSNLPVILSARQNCLEPAVMQVNVGPQL